MKNKAALQALQSPRSSGAVVRVGTVWLTLGLGLLACTEVAHQSTSSGRAGEGSGDTIGSSDAPPAHLPAQPSVTGDAGSSSEPDDPFARCLFPSELPGVALTDRSTTGTGECAGITLQAAIDAVYAAHPELADITRLYGEDLGGTIDGAFIYAFGRGDGGFDLVFQRGSGDCPAGCITKEYFYFETAARCDATQVGHATIDGAAACIAPTEQPMWGVPHSLPPSRYCGADLTAQRLPATLALQACGTVDDCGTARSLTAMNLSITQNEADLSQATVVFSGSGLVDLDGRPWVATVARRHLHVESHESNLPAQCIESVDFTFDYDLDGYGASPTLDLNAYHDCEAPKCKSGGIAQLGPVPR